MAHPSTLGLAITVLLAFVPGRDARKPAFDPKHGAWTALLAKFVKDGSVDYAGMRAESAALERYLGQLRSVPFDEFQKWSKEERLAYWINAYNAFTVRLVLDHYPVKSVKEVGGLFKSVFKKEFIELKNLRGETLSLDDIEHGTIRKEYADARVHFALVCASKSCPPLRAEAYRAADLDRQLDDQGKVFLGDRTKNRIDAARRTLEISPIFDWFEGDFVKADGSVPAFLARFVDEKTAAALRDGRHWEIEFLGYDWSLNGR